MSQVEVVEPTRWTPIVRYLREFESYLATDAPRLQLVNANDRQWPYEEYRRRKREYKICAGSGVYLIFCPDETLRYVGLATGEFDDRIWYHDEFVSRRWTDVISFPKGWTFLAPALEYFLIVKLQPPDNRVFRKYSIDNRPTAIANAVPSAQQDAQQQ